VLKENIMVMKESQLRISIGGPIVAKFFHSNN
jgi:hypothetical protein